MVERPRPTGREEAHGRPGRRSRWSDRAARPVRLRGDGRQVVPVDASRPRRASRSEPIALRGLGRPPFRRRGKPRSDRKTTPRRFGTPAPVRTAAEGGSGAFCITIGGMRRVLACTATATVALAGAWIGAARGDARTPHVATWVYDAHLWAPARVESELARVPGGARRLYVSVESGRRLVLDDPAAAARIGQLLDVAHGRGLDVEAMLLQDPEWAADADGAVRRIERALAFHAGRRAAGRPAFAGLHFDIEPHTEEAWQCADAGGRAEIVRGLQRVFAAVARRVAAEGGGLRLSAALPWWLGPLSEHVREAAPAGWLADLDEVVLMVYGDPGGPLVGETPAAVIRRVDDARLWGDLPARPWTPDRARQLRVPGRGRAGGRAPGGGRGPRRPPRLPRARRLRPRATLRRPARDLRRGPARRSAGPPRRRRAGAGGRPGDAQQPVRAVLPPPAARRRPPRWSPRADGFAPARFTAAGLVPGRHRELPRSPSSRADERGSGAGWLVALLVAFAATAGAQTPPADPLAEPRALVRAGKLEEAVAAYTRVLEANPEALEARAERGRVLGWLRRFPEALADLDAVLAVMPRDVDVRIGRSRDPRLLEEVRRGRGRGPPRAGRRSRGRRGPPRPRRLLRLAGEVRGSDRRVRAGPGARAEGARALARPRQGPALAGGPEGRDGSLRSGPRAGPGQRRREGGAGPDRRDPADAPLPPGPRLPCTRRSAAA